MPVQWETWRVSQRSATQAVLPEGCLQHFSPPTSAAAKHHNLHVYYQVQHWEVIAADELRPGDWVWQEISRGLVLVQTDLPAPKQ